WRQQERVEIQPPPTGEPTMKKILSLTLASFLLSGAALADDDCNEPTADWQPRENLQQLLEEHGWEVKRIKVDDGCYEAKGTDRAGNRVEATYTPASLKLQELKIRFDNEESAAQYLNLPATPTKQ